MVFQSVGQACLTWTIPRGLPKPANAVDVAPSPFEPQSHNRAKPKDDAQLRDSIKGQAATGPSPCLGHRDWAIAGGSPESS